MNTPLPVPSQKKSRLWIILGVLLIALVIGCGAGVYFGTKFVTKSIAARKERRAKFAELESQQREFLKAAKESAEEGTVDGAADRIAKFSQSMGNAAEASSGVDKQSLLVAQRLMQAMTPAVGKYEAAFKELQAAEILRVDTIDSKETIANRAVTVKKFGEANDYLMKILESLESRVRVELEKEGVSSHTREQFVSGFLKSANVEMALEVRKCDNELAAAMQEVLALLDREWGAWKVESGSVNFTRDAVSDEYNGFIDKIDEIGERQLAAQQALLKRAGQRLQTR